MFKEFCAFILLLIVLAMVGLLMFMAIILIDVCVAPIKTTVTTIETKLIIPASSTMVPFGRVMVSKDKPESYQLRFDIKGEEISSSVEKELFDSVVTNDKIEVRYKSGRKSGLCIPVKIKKSE